MNQATYIQLKEKANRYTPEDFMNLLNFQEALCMACEMLNNEEWGESLQRYAVNLLEQIRKKYPERWNSSWRYEALLGYAYHIILEYDNRYECYKRAFNKIQPAPPQLLVAMARCCIGPGHPPITIEDAIALVKEAIRTTPYVEAVELLKGLYKFSGNIKEQKHWEDVLAKIKVNGHHLPPLDYIPSEDENKLYNKT